jgi:hypothetical protein
MKTIKATVVDGVITPKEQIPDNAKMVVFNGKEYVIYEDGDELPVIE